MWKRGKLTTILVILQVALIVLFAIFVRYDEAADASAPVHSKPRTMGGADPDNNPVKSYYPMFQDVHVMIFIGFGFLMTFLKRYGYGSVGFNLLLAALVIQWATVMSGLLHLDDGKIYINIETMLTSDFAAAAVLISFGAVLGKLSCVQLVVMAVVEIAIFSVNEYIGVEIYEAVDVGGSMFVHIFGAYFGIALARVVYTDDAEDASSKEGAVYHSDLFSMIGTVFLWIYWPSFNSALAPGDDQHRAVLNTYFALASCVIMSVAVSALVNKHDKLDMVHIQNATLAGGVAVGTSADMMIHPWGALVIGAAAGTLSVLGYKFLSPFLASKLKLHDTCGVNNLHGMPGILAAIAGIVVSSMADESDYGFGVYQIFPARAPEKDDPKLAFIQRNLSSVEAGDGRSAGEQAAWQAAAMATTLALAIVGGIVTGLILRLPIWDQPKGDQVFDDTDYWEMPEEGFPVGDVTEVTIVRSGPANDTSNTKV